MKRIAKSIALNAIESVKASEIARKIKMDKTNLFIKNKKFRIPPYFYIFGAGKASLSLAYELNKKFEKRILGGVVLSYKSKNLGRIKALKSNHPLIGRDSLSSTNSMLREFDKLSNKDFFIFILSGGASSMLEKLDNSITLKKAIELNEKWLRSGLSIEEVNSKRKSISQIKGGKLGKKLKEKGLKGVVVVISDVVGDDLSVIGSSPLYPYYPHIIIANNLDMLKKAKKEAELRGFKSKIMTNLLKGEAREVAKVLLSIAKYEKKKGKKKLCFIYGGETTVTVKGKGNGGRNQELCLSALIDMEKEITLLSIGSDGIDFNEYAGAVVDYSDLIKSKKYGLDLKSYLKNNDSTGALKKLNSLIKTGYTGTNVMDMVLVFIE